MKKKLVLDTYHGFLGELLTAHMETQFALFISFNFTFTQGWGGDYRIVAFLSKGGYGDTYKAYCPRGNEWVFFKLKMKYL